jgi:copper chaperone CopZ
MGKKTITIPNISCGHCVASIQSEVNELEGVNFVGGSPEDKTITVEWEVPATFEAIRDKLKEINYPIQE